MAETQQKRPREDEKVEFDHSFSTSKRPKPYNNILSLLDEEEENDDQNQDLSAIFTTLQQEIISSSAAAFDFESTPFTAEVDQKTDAGADGDDGVESVMRHLLEASDDELGIPSNEDYNINFEEIRSSNDEFGFANFVDIGLWELEDVAANYYTMLQSELFM